MVAISAGLLASAMLLQPAAATFNWGAAKPFNNPNNVNNVCNDQQKSGFDWKNLPPGNFNKFGDFDFSGFSCKDSFSGRKGRRSLQARNGFQQKVIEGRCTADKASAPKISCGTDKNFSVKEMQISVEFDTDIDFEYTMADGSSCKETQRCSAGGSTISNRQCGGAKSVTFKRPTNGKDCNIGIHKVDFDCEGPAPPPPPPPPSTTPSTTTQTTTVSTKSSSTTTKSSFTTASTSTKTTTTQSSSACTSCSKSTSAATSSTSSSTSSPSTTSFASTTSSVSSSSTSSSLSTSTVTSSVPTSKTFTTLPPYANTTTSQSDESQTSSTEIPNTLTSTTSEVPNTLNTTTAPQTVTTTSEQVTTELTFVTLTTCDVTLTQTTGDITVTQTTQTLSTTTLTSTVTFCPKCGETVPTRPGLPPTPPSSTGEAPPPPPGTTSAESTTSAPSTLQTSSTSAVPPPPPPPPADTPQSPCPETLPRCMNTWLSLTKCTSNSDASCMCPNSEFTKSVISCVTAWGASDTEIQAALSYFAGICAAFVPQNPGICTDVPTSITLIPTIAPTNPASPPPSGTASPPPPPAVNPEGPQGTRPAEVPRTTITLVNTVTAPSAGGQVQTTTQFITVPQVTFVTGSPETGAAVAAPTGGEGASASPAPAPVGLVPMPQPVQAGPTTPASAASSTPVVVAGGSGHAAPSGASTPVANISTTGGAANPKISQFEGAAVAVGVTKVVMGAAAGVLAVAAFAL